MQVTRLTLRDFRSYERAEVPLGGALTVVHGPNGAGKTNLLEALYVGATGVSCRTGNDRELVRFGAPAARVELSLTTDAADHTLAVGIATGERKRFSVDGSPVERLLDAPQRPLIGVFLPERLELVKGAPARRRAHLDQVVTALWPARAEVRRSYGRALQQRNALLSRYRGAGDAPGLDAWDAELAERGAALMADRAETVAAIAPGFAGHAGALGLPAAAELVYRPRSKATDAEGLMAELAERRADDLARGFTAHGPHRDDLALRCGGRDLRVYGSQGQQRVSVLALLLAERDAIAEQRPAPPLLLLDDVMSELDAERRARLVVAIGAAGGQALVTATEPEHVPSDPDVPMTRIAVSPGTVRAEAVEVEAA
jgi:DNA replication and repair protein RecF